jgi:cellulose synthase/poly-beta-1,6-N-acetylglucosamine synthase-like glycosyltransferase
MSACEWIFWISVGSLIYAFLLYPLALWLASRMASQIRRKRAACPPAGSGPIPPKEWPGVSLIVPAHNEERHLAAKLRNIEEIEYPRERIECVLVSDGSTDATDRILTHAAVPGRRFFRLAERQGKPTALNLAVAHSTGEILIFSDASTLLAPDAVGKLVRHFDDSRVGAVCGAVVFRRTMESAATEGIYWKYETALRRMEAEIGATLTASGAIFALRRSCYRPLAPETILDDFLLPMTTRRLGYRVEYEPKARAQDAAPESVSGEYTRRVRLAAGSFQSLGTLAQAARSHLAVLWAFLSHKVMRWLAPWFLIGIFATTLALREQPFYGLALVFEAAFCSWALVGWVCRKRLAKIRFALMGYFLMAMNVAFLVGLARLLTGRQPVTWTRANG